jgi:hypothetical protein
VGRLVQAPELCHSRIDFEPRIRRVLGVLLAGYVAVGGDP